MISVTITDRSGRTLSGQTIDAFWMSIAHAKPFSVGINCALGARDMRPYLAELARLADCYVSCYPNAGLPNAFGEYDEQPAETGRAPARVRHERLRQHRRRLLRHDAGSHRGDCDAVDGVAPRPLPADAGSAEPRSASRDPAPELAAGRQHPEPAHSQFAGLEDADDPPRHQLPDDRRADQRHRLGAVRAADQGRRLRRGGRQVALEQVRGGANLIDVNMDEGMLDSEQAMTDVPELHRHRAGDRARAVHDRQLEVVGASRPA